MSEFVRNIEPFWYFVYLLIFIGTLATFSKEPSPPKAKPLEIKNLHYKRFPNGYQYQEIDDLGNGKLLVKITTPSGRFGGKMVVDKSIFNS